MQNIQFSFSQQVNMLFEIGSGWVYYVAGRAQGTGTIARFVGPPTTVIDLLALLGDACKPKDLQLNADSSNCYNAGSTSTVQGGTAGTAAATHRSYTLQGTIMTGLGSRVNANDVMISEDVQFMFANLSLTGTGIP